LNADVQKVLSVLEEKGSNVNSQACPISGNTPLYPQFQPIETALRVYPKKYKHGVRIFTGRMGE